MACIMYAYYDLMWRFGHLGSKISGKRQGLAWYGQRWQTFLEMQFLPATVLGSSRDTKVVRISKAYLSSLFLYKVFEKYK
jgi:hypothetical protein